MDTTPKTCREWKGKIVIVTSEMRNRGGCVFHAGERLIVRRKRRDGTFELYRPEEGNLRARSC